MKIIKFLFIDLIICYSSYSQTGQYTYDNLNRLSEIKYDNGSNILYTYDANGNRIQQVNSNTARTIDLQWVTPTIAPATLAAGASVNINANDFNAGTGSAGYHQIKAWLSTNNILDAGDIRLDSITVSNLLGGDSYAINNWQVTIPQNTTQGNYFILLQTDALQSVTESVETNNIFTQAITVNSCSAINVTSTLGQPGCGLSNGSIALNATGGMPPYQYSINNGLTYQASNVFLSQSSGNYSCKVTDSKGCTGNTQSTLTLANGTVPVSNFNFTANGLSVSFANTSTNATSYTWDFGNGVTSNSNSPVYTYPSAGNYTVCLTASNSCGGAVSCKNDVLQTVDQKTWVKMYDVPDPENYQSKTLITLHYSKTDKHIYRLQRYITNEGSYKLIFSKTSTSGNVVWAKQITDTIGTSPNLFIDGISETSDGFTLLLRGFSGGVGGYSRMIKVSKTGERIWSKSVARTPNESINIKYYQGLDYAGLLGGDIIPSAKNQGPFNRPSRVLSKFDVNGNLVGERELVIPEYQFSYFTNAQINIIKCIKKNGLYYLFGYFKNTSYTGSNYLMYIVFDNNWNILVNKKITVQYNFYEDIFKVEELSNGNFGIGGYIFVPQYIEIDQYGNIVTGLYVDAGANIIGRNAEGRYLFHSNSNNRIDVLNNNYTAYSSIILPKSSFFNQATYNTILIEDTAILTTFYDPSNTVGLINMNRVGKTGLCSDSSNSAIFAKNLVPNLVSETNTISFNSISSYNATSNGYVGLIDFDFSGHDFCTPPPPCPVKASFSETKSNICIGDSIIFSSTSLNASTLQWKINNVNKGISDTSKNVFPGAGVYTVQLIASNGICKDTLTKTYVVNSAIQITAELTNAVCNQRNGQIIINSTGGTQPYSYSVDDGGFGSENLFKGYLPGNYTLIVKDLQGCVSDTSISITNTTSPINVLIDSVSVSCSNLSSGSLKVTAFNAVSPIIYNWNTGDSTQQINNLSTGAYTINIADAAGCKFNQTYQLASSSVSVRRSAISRGFWNNPLSWEGGTLPGPCDSVVIKVGQVLEMNQDVEIRALNILSTGALLINAPSKTLQIGSSQRADANCIVNGTMNISFGNIKINGRLKAVAGSVFAMTGGSFTLDGNSGSQISSIVNGIHLFDIPTGMLNFVISGGIFNIIDPPFGANSQAISCSYNFGNGSNLKFGDGISITTSNNPDGFGGNLLPAQIGSFTLDAKTLTGNRHFINKKPLSIKSPVNIISGKLVQSSLLQIRN